MLWALGFDTIYAMSDREDDRKLGVNSSALFFGNYAPTAIAVCFALTVLLMTWLGVTMQLQVAFWIALGLAAIGWTWQYLRLKNPQMPSSAYGEMFRQNVWIGFIILAGMIAGVI